MSNLPKFLLFAYIAFTSKAKNMQPPVVKYQAEKETQWQRINSAKLILILKTNVSTCNWNKIPWFFHENDFFFNSMIFLEKIPGFPGGINGLNCKKISAIFELVRELVICNMHKKSYRAINCNDYKWKGGLKSDINQQDLKIVDLPFVKSK